MALNLKEFLFVGLKRISQVEEKHHTEEIFDGRSVKWMEMYFRRRQQRVVRVKESRKVF